ncbi:MAG: Rrf2 family transcriptional regulator [Thermoleophilaceae bacterium]|nr:Rrf2 family transcriptional regulator [Thermoleophilaceae bacterium]
MRISAKVDYAVRAAAELAGAGKGPLKGERISVAQDIPVKFLENILLDLKVAGIVASQRGPEGGYWLARAASETTIADVIRAVEGPLASVRGARPETLEYKGAAEALVPVWIALRASLRAVLEAVTLEDVAGEKLPARILDLTRDPEAWAAH